MRIDYKGETYDIGELDLDDLTFDEIEKVEKVLGIPWDDLRSKMREGSILPTRPLIWTMLRRQIPELRFDDLAGIKGSDLHDEPVDPTEADVSETSAIVTVPPSPNDSGSSPGNGDGLPLETSTTSVE